MSGKAFLPAGARRASAVAWVIIALLLIVGGFMLWRVGVFTPSPKVALVTSGEGPYWDLVIAGAREAAEAFDVKLSIVKSKSDSEAQSASIRELLAKGKYDGVAVSPVNPIAEAAVLADVSARSTLVTIDSDSPLSARLCFVGTDNYAAGRLCADQLRKALPDGGEVIICIGNPDKENTQRRRQGVIDELLERNYEPDHAMDPLEGALKGPQFTVVATLVDHSDPAKTVELLTAALKDNPNIKGVVGLLGYSTPAILKALEAGGKQGQIKVVGFDNAEETLAGIEAGHVHASILQDQFGAGYQAVRILADNARGNRTGLPIFQRRTLPCEVINVENVKAMRAQLKAEPAAKS
ncbi:MAG TPA: substrate-binding domain-containing protein [Tepidisphaeraceae bacterium]|nr:substrate-binding domain-containing protein [Tepidisphaeraceae bacterium]